MVTFKETADDIRDNGLMNQYVDEAINSGVGYAKLRKEIQMAMRMHRKWSLQRGSSVLHIAITCAMARLLDALEGENVKPADTLPDDFKFITVKGR